MSLSRTRRSAALVGAGVAMVAALAGPVAASASPASAEQAPAAAATSIFETFTSLNLGKNLASNLSGFAVGTTPNATSTFQQWARVREFGVPAVPGFVVPYRLKNRATGLCLRDVGEGAQVREETCHTHVTAGCAQLWHNHAAPDRTINGTTYYFRFARTSGRALALAPQFGTAIPVLSTKDTGGPGSANEALKLWAGKAVAVG